MLKGFIMSFIEKHLIIGRDMHEDKNNIVIQIYTIMCMYIFGNPIKNNWTICEVKVVLACCPHV